MQYIIDVHINAESNSHSVGVNVSEHPNYLNKKLEEKEEFTQQIPIESIKLKIQS